MDLAVLTHDLRAPIQAILVGLEILRQKPRETSEDRLVVRIYEATRRMRSLVDRLLRDASLRHAGPFALDRDTVDLTELCREVAEEFRIGHPGREIRVEAETPVRGLWDRLRLVELVSNLLANALEHGHSSTPVLLRVRERGSMAEIEVRNQGSAIPRDRSKLMFGPFRRAPSARRKGVGLGLYIVAKIAALHGGTIDFASGRDGTRFTVSLPAGRSERQSTPAVAARTRSPE
jgi:signal transduction histidine kinase